MSNRLVNHPERTKRLEHENRLDYICGPSKLLVKGVSKRIEKHHGQREQRIQYRQTRPDEASHENPLPQIYHVTSVVRNVFVDLADVELYFIE